MLITSTIAQSKKQAFQNAGLKSVLTVSMDSKTVKGLKRGYLTGILYLAPHNIVTSKKVKTVCPNAVNAGCSNACLYSAGRGRFTVVQEGRINRTKAFLSDPNAFMVAVWYDVQGLIRKALKQGLTPCVRLNGTSDLPFHNIRFTSPTGQYGSIMEQFPDLIFYDYTKNVHLNKKDLPSNYHIVFSFSQYSADYAGRSYRAAIRNSAGLAVVFRKDLPDKYHGLPVINADNDDLRFLDKDLHGITGPYIAGLKAKGAAKTDTSGFVIDTYRTIK